MPFVEAVSRFHAADGVHNHAWLSCLQVLQVAYEFVRYSPKHRNGAVALLTRLWREAAAETSAYFRWKYETHPHAAEPLVYLALDGDEVVGMRGFCRHPWRNRRTGESVSVVTASDTVVDPGHESKGVFRQIMAFASDDLERQGVDLMINLNASPATFFRSIRSGWLPVQAHEPVRIETGVWSATDRLGTRISRLPGLWRLKGDDVLHRISRVLHRVPKLQRPLILSDQPRVADISSLAEQEPMDQRFTLQRDQEFLDWRFNDPMASFRFLYWDEGGLQGYVVLNTRRRHSFGHYSIFDWQAADPEIGRALLQASLSVARPAAISAWTGSRSESEIEQLRSAGFRPFDASRQKKRYEPSLLIKPLDSAGATKCPGLESTDAWNVRMLFGD